MGYTHLLIHSLILSVKKFIIFHICLSVLLSISIIMLLIFNIFPLFFFKDPDMNSDDAGDTGASEQKDRRNVYFELESSEESVEVTEEEKKAEEMNNEDKYKTALPGLGRGQGQGKCNVLEQVKLFEQNGQPNTGKGECSRYFESIKLGNNRTFMIGS